MTGRIRSVKPEWLDDERMMSASANARVLSVGLLLLADDYGNGRGSDLYLYSRVFPSGSPDMAKAAAEELEAIGYVHRYQSDGQTYFHIRNWSKHQKVDKPGKPAVPPPPDTEPMEDAGDMVYFAQQGGADGPIKIGRSQDPESRVKALACGNHKDISLLGVIHGGFREREIHKRFKHLRTKREWFRPGPDLIEFIRVSSRSVRESFVSGSEAFAPRAIPSHSPPIQDPETRARDSKASTGTPKRRGWTRVPEDWAGPNEAHRTIARERGVNVEFEAQKFRDHEYTRPKKDPDAAFRNWLRGAHPEPRRGSRPVQTDTSGRTGFENAEIEHI